jgi:flagellar hook protein FlgE
MANQRMLDVVGNNLANINTTAFKASRTTFTDLFYNVVRPATSSVSGGIGGTNPAEIGLGVRIGQISRNLQQGNLEETGQLLDFAIEGEGMFVLSNGASNVYSRAGSFALDASGCLVDPATGYRVQRFGRLGESDGESTGFQTPGDSSIRVPFGVSIPGEPTMDIQLSGNLSADATGPRAAILATANPFTAGGVVATATTLLNDLDGRGADYVAGDQIVISGTDDDGTAISTNLAAGPTTTLGDLVAAINAEYTGAVAQLTTDGTLELRALATGPSMLSLSLADGVLNTGITNWETYRPEITVAGKDGDTFSTALEVFDVRGGAHTVRLTFQKQDDSSWDITATLSGDGEELDGSVEGLRFREEGTFEQIVGSGTGDANLIFRFPGLPTPQTMTVSVTDLTHLSTASLIMVDQDGYAPGELASINVGSDGEIQGIATNGRRISVAQLAIAAFPNAQGLSAAGQNYFTESLNSGLVTIGAAMTGGRGIVRGAQLESSNVDMALEFTKLIVAQRAFSANARTITVSSEMLQELTGIVK